MKTLLFLFMIILLWLSMTAACISVLMLKRKIPRYYLFILPIVCFIVCTLTMIWADDIAGLLIRLLQWLAGKAAMIPLIGRFLSGFLYFLANNALTQTGAFVLANLIIVAVYGLVKYFSINKIKEKWENDHDLFRETSGTFYQKYRLRGEWDEQTHQFKTGSTAYGLKKKYTAVRTISGALTCTAVIILLLCIAGLIFGWVSNGWAVSLFPVCGILVLGEIYCYLGGKIKLPLNKNKEVPSEQINAECLQIQDSLKDLFKERVCYHDQLAPRKVNAEADEKDLEPLYLADDYEELAETYFTSLIEQGIALHPDYRRAAGDLLRGKSMIILNPFYRDFSVYLMLPIIHHLLQSHRILIVCGRTTDKEDIQSWMSDSVFERTGLSKLWLVDEISEKGGTEDTGIGILHFQDLYNIEVQNKNQEFFDKVEMVVLLEPSNVLGTGQIGLRNLLERCETNGQAITYCIIDRPADGLVDAMSHMIRQSLTEVLAPPASEAGSCRIFWHADGPGLQNRIISGISKYLGMGTEIAVQAMKLGASPVCWFSNLKVPLTDLRWNISQYYPLFCSYIGLNLEQSELEDHLSLQTGLWQTSPMKKGFLLVEDEFCNAFDMARTFGSRLEEKGFINILSENYLFRDYMADNPMLFTNDPKAIPSIVPDYARTERNFVIRMLLMMSNGPVEESYINKQLAVHGLEAKNTLKKMQELIFKHTGIDKFYIQTTAVIIRGKDFPATRFSLSISQEQLEQVYQSSLKSAFYVIENEKLKSYPMGNRLMGHIEQTILPGQFFTWEGRYYQALSISAQNGIIVRRAGEHFNKRVYYRQLRTYSFKDSEIEKEVSEVRTMKLRRGFATIEVETDGYLEMETLNDLQTASLVNLSPASRRTLFRKEFLQIELENAPDDILFTISLLLNEAFRTLYPNETGYLTAFPGSIPDAVRSDPMWKSGIRALVPDFSGEFTGGSYIYIVEDSHLDLGLLVSVERNLQRIFESITDYLNWYFEKQKAES